MPSPRLAALNLFPSRVPFVEPGASGLLTREAVQSLRDLSKLLEWLEGGTFASLKAFGAKGDGLTDDTAAVQRALDSGQPILAGPGTYLLADEVVLRDGTTLFAAPGSALFTKPVGSTHNLLSGTDIEGVSLVGLSFDGQRRHGGGVTGRSIWLSGVARARIAGCDLYDGININLDNGCSDVAILANVMRHGMGGVGIGISVGAAVNRGILIQSNVIRDMRDEAIDSNKAVQGLSIVGNWCFNNHTGTDTGREVIDIGGETHEDVSVIGNVIDCNQVALIGVHLKEGVKRASVVGNVIVNGEQADSGGRGINVSACEDVTIRGNVVHRFYRGIQVANTRRATIEGNDVTEALAFGISTTGGLNTDSRILGNTVEGTGASGIGIDVDGYARFDVSRNTVRAFGLAGIRMTATASDGQCCGNQVSGCDDGISASAPRTLISGNLAFENGDTGITVNAKRVTLADNQVRDNAQVTADQFGILVNAGMDYLVATGNQVYDTQGVATQNGLRFAGACDRCIVRENLLYPSKTTSLSGTGSLTNSLVGDNITA